MTTANGTMPIYPSHRLLLKATAILATSSCGTILLGLFSVKVWALIVGPTGVGHAALLQGLAALASIGAMGLSHGLVRFGPPLLANSDHAGFNALVRAAWIIWAYGIAAAALLLVLFSKFLADWLGGDISSAEVSIMALVVAAASASALQSSVINAYHRLKTLAWTSIAGSFFGLLISLPLLYCFGRSAIIGAVLTNSLMAFLVSSYAYRHTRRLSSNYVHSSTFRQARNNLLAFGIPVAVSVFLGSGVQHLLPSLIVHHSTQEEAGFFRAASTIAFGYFGLLLTALGQDYYPRLAAVRSNREDLIAVFGQQFHFTICLAFPLIIGMIITSRWVVPLCYTTRFSPAVPLLNWLMLGASLKMPACCLGYLMLARCSRWAPLITEALTGAIWLILSLLGLHLLGLRGIGIAYVITQGANLLMSALALKREVGWMLAWRQVLALFGLTGLAGGVLALNLW